jgi:3-phenylpropionate/trans-cinnamate dioxygenase ferredoxin subunit
MSLGFETVARADEVAEGSQRPVTVAGRRLVLCRSEGQYFAFENRCTHDNEALLGGVLRKCTIVCPMHGARFDLQTGRPFGPPAFEPLLTFAVRVTDDGHLEVALTQNVA